MVDLHCYIFQGTYTVKNWIFRVKLFTNTFPYNKYKAKFTWIEDGRIQTCVNVEVEIVPKIRTNG